MQFLGRIIGTVSNVFTNPYRVREVQLSDYRSRVKMKQDERIYALKLRPFYETLHPPLKPETLQPIVDCLRNHPDWSSAHIAVDTGLRDCLKHNHVLSQMNVRDAQGQTPLHLACERGEVSCVRELIEECQARTDIRDKSGDTPMHCAAKQDSAVIVEAIVLSSQVLCSRLCPGVNELNQAGEAPLHIACRLGKTGAARALIKGGARSNVIGGYAYPIHTAMKYSAKGCAELILADDLNQLSAEDPIYGGTPLHWAKTAEMSRLLLDHGCSLNYLSKTGESPLHIMCKRGRYEAAMTLLTHGVNPNLKGENGNTALHLAMKEKTGQEKTGQEKTGPDKMGKSKTGFNDLIHAAAAISAISQGYTEVDGLKTGKKRDRLLCLDGGGIKGLVLIQLLIAIEKEAGRPIRELFDWVAGTSTGGILALAVIHGKSMEYLRCLYFRMKDEVFKGSRPYESAPLEDFLKQEFGENTMMTDVRHPKVMVTKQVVWRAARSSGAAPTYFRPMGRFLDGDVLIQISETQRKLTAEVEGVFCWFHVEVLQALDKNVRLDEEYIGGSRRVYELEVRNQAANLERQLRRGAYRDSLQKTEGWKERVNESQSSRSRTPTPLEQDTHLRAAVSSLLQPGDRDEGWPGQDHQLGRVPSRAPSPLQTRSRSGSVSESPVVSGGQQVKALVSHPTSSNPVLLPFSRGDTITLLVPEPRNGWMYGRHDASLRQGWFPASYVAPVEDLSSMTPSLLHRNHGTNNPLEATSQSQSMDIRNYGEVPPSAPPLPRGSSDHLTVSPLLDRKTESVYEVTSSQSYNEIPPPAPPLRRASGDLRPVSPLLDRRAESHFESMTGYAVPERKVEPILERPNPHRQLPDHPLFPSGYSAANLDYCKIFRDYDITVSVTDPSTDSSQSQLLTAPLIRPSLDPSLTVHSVTVQTPPLILSQVSVTDPVH
ncbi:85/88 kDa calcium-independent phospholipase A2 [Bagarius yarrelli]|uniref:phospholipase A2 n=1 Tax=Bagarius yarrelli TaxID=175774 RepID=A0A556TTZ3_BAGYA|nr:85/88 kDa calcium-independent phospholipase A2 [Bagarius yarrelli]